MSSQKYLTFLSATNIVVMQPTVISHKKCQLWLIKCATNAIKVQKICSDIKHKNVTNKHFNVASNFINYRYQLQNSKNNQYRGALPPWTPRLVHNSVIQGTIPVLVFQFYQFHFSEF